MGACKVLVFLMFCWLRGEGGVSGVGGPRHFAVSVFGEGPDVQFLACKFLRQQQLQASAAALARGAEARGGGGAVDVEVYAVGEASALAAPADGDGISLVDSVLQRRRRCKAA